MIKTGVDCHLQCAGEGTGSVGGRINATLGLLTSTVSKPFATVKRKF